MFGDLESEHAPGDRVPQFVGGGEESLWVVRAVGHGWSSPEVVVTVGRCQRCQTGGV
jgi:hypothetical protein